MARRGFGRGGTRRTIGGVPSAVVQQITTSGVAFNFAASRPAGRYANGDWWVLGPVTITSVTPQSSTMDGTRADGSSYTGRAINGTMVNPGNRSFAVGGLTIHNAGSNSGANVQQGMDSLTGSIGYRGYSAALNVDPGATGVPLTVTTGTVVKCLSATNPAQVSALGRQAPQRFVTLTVVDTVPAPDAIRPGMSRANTTSLVRASDIDLSVFQNLAPVAGTPSYETVFANLLGPFNTFDPDSINSANMMPQTNAEYGREVANRIHAALLCLHLSSFTADQKRTLLIHLLTFAEDIVSRAEEGALGFANGGGNQWKKPALVVAAASLKNKAPASWLAACDGSRFPNPNDVRQVFAEDAHYSAITDRDIALPRLTADGRPRTAFSYLCLGSVDWGNWNTRSDAGMNWDTLFYRNIYNPALLPGIQAVELTEGGLALWNNPQPFLYMKTQWHRRDAPLIDATNRIQPFARAFMEAYRAVDPGAPQIVVAQVKDANWFVRFDKALDELVTAPAAGDFTIRVNGTPVAVTGLTVWRTAVGGTFAQTVTGNDTVTISYTPGANPLRSVDAVNVAGFTNRTATNRSDKVGGPNAAYPIVCFANDVMLTIGGTQRIHTANSQVGTFALLKFKFDAAPTSTATIFGHASGAGPIFIQLTTARNLDIRIQNSGGTTIHRVVYGPLTAGVSYDILMSIDMAQAVGSNSFSLYVNGSAITGSPSTFTSGAAIGWSTVNSSIRWNQNGFAGEVGAFWLDATTRVDLTNAANRAKFNSITAGDLDIKTRGDGITGTIPQIFLVGHADQWNDAAGINRGTGNKFFVSSTSSEFFNQVSGSEWV